VRKGWTDLAPGGEMLLLLRLAFLEGRGRAEGLWKEMPPTNVLVLANRIPFHQELYPYRHKLPELAAIPQGWWDDHMGKSDDTAYALYHWHKSLYADNEDGQTNLKWLVWR
jgi:hypothetical protein